MVLVIHEKDHHDNEDSVIGVADSVENADKIIEEYYGGFKLLRHTYIGEGNLEYSRLLEVEGATNEYYQVTITLQWFSVNEV